MKKGDGANTNRIGTPHDTDKKTSFLSMLNKKDK